MPTSDDVAVAGRLGLLAARTDGLATCEEALGLVLDALGGEAGSLVLWSEHGSRVAAEYGYDASVSSALAEEFPRTPWMTMLAHTPLPPTVSTEPGSTFRDGWLFCERIEPSGFRDGITGRLVGPTGHTVGFLHASSSRPGRFGVGRQRALAGMLPSLSALVNAAVVDQPAQAALAPSTVDRRTRAVAEQLTPGWRLRYWQPTPTGWRRSTLRPPAETAGWCRQEQPVAHAPYSLTQRELEILTGLALAMTDQQLAGLLALSLRTVHTHVDHVRTKLGAPTRTAAAVRALTEGLAVLSLPVAAERLVGGLGCRL